MRNSTAVTIKYKMLSRELVLILLVISCVTSTKLYTVPNPEITVYTPRGFSVSIPHSPGIEVFAFHGNINKRLPNFHAGDYSIDIRDQENGKWTFHETSSRLKIGDVIHYWLFVIKDGLGYRLDHGEFEVQEYGNVKNFVGPPSAAHGPVGKYTNPSEISACLDSILNLTHTVILQQTQIQELEMRNHQMRGLIEQLPDGKKLTLSGKIPMGDAAYSSVSFVLRERLNLSPSIVSAQKNVDGTITFEVATLDDKLDILQGAKEKLSNSKIVIK